MHLHGHAFRPVDGGTHAPLKDTVTVSPMQTTAVEFAADNPGGWVFHCHNAYQAEAGMMRVVEMRT
jgi:FtsP/CotA-like multicopper oxidase with cupredoxin domain